MLLLLLLSSRDPTARRREAEGWYCARLGALGGVGLIRGYAGLDRMLTRV